MKPKYAFLIINRNSTKLYSWRTTAPDRALAPKQEESRKEMPAESTLQRNSESSPAPTPRSDQEGVVMTLVQKMKSVEDSVMG